jgi:hypothetical protein
MPEEPLCRSCRHAVVAAHKIAGKLVPGEYCARRIVCFPTCLACADYEREPGSDDR